MYRFSGLVCTFNSVRSRFAGDEGSKSVKEFTDAICEEIRTKAIRKEEPQEAEKK